MERQAYLKRIKEHLKGAYLLNDAKAAAMLPVFIATLESHVDRLTTLAESGDMLQLSRAGHALKGALLNMGLPDLAATAHALEKNSANQTCSPACQELIIQLRDAVSLLSGKR
ncbi:Hpt domain-containing protein [Desulfobulbus alkaliphilus]|uniref:Hpt domain-containing protein n=1 Tax=Desulfobulbus alkaliphilus TaxID=869814 RepID=UPI00196283E5|nr:Hpt domain-containing protein [Desulfobulbus alkaliphilus]MBM9537631.1 Hpt domain-containing protein [Desulfobulbus alkaliphilus]